MLARRRICDMMCNALKLSRGMYQLAGKQQSQDEWASGATSAYDSQIVSAEAAHVAARRHIGLVDVPDALQSAAEGMAAGVRPTPLRRAGSVAPSEYQVAPATSLAAQSVHM
jgi:hypothetical protein